MGEPVTDHSSVSRPRLIHPALWLVIATVLFVPFIQTRVAIGNVESDLAAIESIVERGSLSIGDSTWAGTIDKMVVRDRFYSQKPPILQLVGASIYTPLHAAGFRLNKDTVLCLRFLIWVLVILPMGALLALIERHPWVARRPARFRIPFLAAIAIGSLFTPFAITLNHYIAAAVCLMVVFNRLTEMSMDSAPDSRDSRRDGIVVGCWSGAAMACEFPPAAILGLGLGVVWLIAGIRKPSGPYFRRLLGMALGAAPWLVAYAVLDMIMFGTPLPAYALGREAQMWPGSIWTEMFAAIDAGTAGFYESSWMRRVYHSLFGYRGVFWMMPLIALAAVRSVDLITRRVKESGLILGVWAFFLVNLAATMWASKDMGGGGYVARHALPALAPVLVMLAHPALMWRGPGSKKIAWRFAAGLAAMLGFVIALPGIYEPWSHNTYSAYPPLHNTLDYRLRHGWQPSPGQVEEIIMSTSLEPAVGLLDLGLFWHNRGEPRRAEAALRDAIKADPELYVVRYHLGVVQDMQKRHTEALETYAPLLKAQPENLGAWNNEILFAMGAGRPDVLQNAVSHSESLLPGNPKADLGRLILEQWAGRAKPDNPLLKEVLARHPNDPVIQSVARGWGYSVESGAGLD